MPARERGHGRTVMAAAQRLTRARHGTSERPACDAVLCRPAGGRAASQAGHEVSYYPSFYPQEIRLEPLDPQAAAARIPEQDRSAQPLCRRQRRASTPRSRASEVGLIACRLHRGVVSPRRKAATVAAPRSPRRPRRGRLTGHRRPPLSGLRPTMPTISPTPTARSPCRAPAAPPAPHDVEIEEIPVNDLLRKSGAGAGIWLAPPWTKEGWFQAYRVLRAASATGASAERADALYERRLPGRFKDAAERLDMQRALVAGWRGCERGIVGYRLRRECLQRRLLQRVENIASDSQPDSTRRRGPHHEAQGLPLERLAARRHRGAATAAWNPVAGFSDETAGWCGRSWATMPICRSPYNSRWVQNRVEIVPDDDERKPKQSVLVPADALMPEVGTGKLVPGRGGQGGDGQDHLSRLGLVLPRRQRDAAGRPPLPLCAGLPLGRGRPGRHDFDPRHRRGDPPAARAARRRAGVARRRARAGDRRPHLPLSQPDRRGAPQRPVGRRGRERADRPAVELGALARAGPDGGRRRAQHRRLLATARRRAAASPGSTWRATRRSSRTWRP